MRVLHIHNWHGTRANRGVAGGEDLSFIGDLELLRAHTHDVRTYTRENVERREYGPVRKFRHFFEMAWSKRTMDDMAELVDEFGPDVALVNSTFSLITPSVFAALKRHGIPVVYYLRNFRLRCVNALFLRDGKVCTDCIRRWPVRGVLHRCYRGKPLVSLAIGRMIARAWSSGVWTRCVDRFIALTEHGRDVFVRAGLPGHKMAVKPNFVPDPLPDGDPGPPGGYAVYAGFLSPHKGVRTLIEAWRRVRFPLKIAGHGRLMDEVRAFAESRPDVEVLGFVDHSRVLELLRGAAFCVFPSVWYETFGRTMIEAFAAGRPVVASDMGAMSSLVRDGLTGLLCAPGDAEDLARKVNELLADRPRLAELGRNARREYESKYTPELNYGMLMEILEEAAG